MFEAEFDVHKNPLRLVECWILPDSIDSVKISSSLSSFEISELHLSLWILGSPSE